MNSTKRALILIIVCLFILLGLNIATAGFLKGILITFLTLAIGSVLIHFTNRWIEGGAKYDNDERKD